MKKRVLLKAPALTSSGYGVHSRQVARYLIEKAERSEIDLKIELVRWGHTPFALDPKMFDGWAGKIMKYVGPVRSKSDVSIQVILPNEWTPQSAHVNIGMSAVVESDRCNPMWIDSCNKMDMVICPSNHTANVLRNSGNLVTPLHVVPESYVDAVGRQVPEVDFGFDTSFNFLVVGQITANDAQLDRKNLFNTVKYLCDEFRNDPDVGIILKTNSGRSTKIDRMSTITRLNHLIGQVRKGAFPKIHLVHGDLTEEEMAALYRDPSVKALVTFTRGEGYGLPILEAAASGVPVIATDWSGHLDFMNRGKFIKIGYTLKPIPSGRVSREKHQDRNIWMEGSRWAEPSETNIKAALRKFRVSPELPKQWAEDLGATLRREYSFDAIRDMYDELLLPIIGT